MILVFVIVVWTQLAAAGVEACTIPASVMVTEGTENGTCVQRLSDQDDVSAVYYDNPRPPPFLDIVNGSLCLNATLTLDTDQSLCGYLVTNGQWTLYVICHGDSANHRIYIPVNYTDDFPPQFTANFTRQIQEMTIPQTPVLTVTNNDVTDADCNNNLQVGVNTIFSIEGGNTRDAFAFTSDRTGVLVVNRWLDYESGDRRFDLNISLADIKNREEKSFTTVTVEVTDIDDSDPVFGHPGYRLGIPEQDTSAVGAWQLTDPPVTVLDPDRDVQPPDTLVVSLYNSSDESKVKVNASGAVQLQTTFDREQLAQFTVVLKVSKAAHYWRSSTVTLTVTVDDVNDNRPQFDPSVYHFSLPEHSPPSTSVGLVFATDRDTGDNAIFNYTLLSHDALFNMETYNGGLVGVLRVQNSTLLDRETTPEVMVRIGTEELTMAEGGNCSAGHCEVTVKVTLLDINDHSPIFGRPSYNVTVLDYVPNDVILTMHATDDDVGGNGDVTYAVRSAEGGVCGDVRVDVRSGNVSVTSAVQQSVQCSVVIDACDNPSQPSYRRCASVPLQVGLYVTNYTVLLHTSVSPQVLTPHVPDIQRRLSDLLGVTVTVVNIGQNTATQGSQVLISATSSSSQDAIPQDQLQQLADQHRQEISALFLSYLTTTTAPSSSPTTHTPTPPANATNTTTTPTPTQTDKSTDRFPPHVIALIVVSSFLLLALVVALYVIYKGHRRHKRHQRLMHNLSIPTHIYDNAELRARAHSQHTTTTPTSTTTPLPLVSESSGGGGGQEEEGGGVTNPIFQDDDTPTLPRHLTLLRCSEAEDDEVVERGGRKEEEEEARRSGTKRAGGCPDADSGVPSDRENGGGESSESSGSSSFSRDGSPVLSRSEAETGSMGSAYLNAVLRDLLTSAAVFEGGEEEEGEMIDVTSPPPPVLPLYGGGGSGSETYADSLPRKGSGSVSRDSHVVDISDRDSWAGGGPPPPPPPPLVSQNDAYGKEAQKSAPPPPPPPPPPALPLPVPTTNPHAKEVKGAVTSREDGGAGSSAAAAHDVTARMTFSEETGEVSGPPLHPDPARLMGAVMQELMMSRRPSQDNLSPDNGEEEEKDDDDDDDDDEESGNSELSRRVNLHTPPMHRSARGKEEEEEEMPEEPEPDYAKRVHFSSQVTEVKPADGDGAQETKQAGQEMLGSGKALPKDGSGKALPHQDLNHDLQKGGKASEDPGKGEGPGEGGADVITSPPAVSPGGGEVRVRAPSVGESVTVRGSDSAPPATVKDNNVREEITAF